MVELIFFFVCVKINIMMNENDFKKLVADNLAYYRKANNLTQIELAEKLNYSDKSISKWERGEGLPDSYTLHQITALYGISLNDLITEKKTLPLKQRKYSNLLISLIAFGIVWLLATIVYVALGIFLPGLKKAWLAFIYAIPVSMIVLIVFCNLWGKKYHVFLTLSVLYWTIPLSIYLSIDYEKLWLLFLIIIPLQILTIFWFLLHKRKTKH